MIKKHYKKKTIFSYLLKSYLQEIRALLIENKSQSQSILIEKLSCLIREWWYFLNFCPFSNCFLSDPFLTLNLPSTSSELEWDSCFSGFFFSKLEWRQVLHVSFPVLVFFSFLPVSPLLLALPNFFYPCFGKGVSTRVILAISKRRHLTFLARRIPSLLSVGSRPSFFFSLATMSSFEANYPWASLARGGWLGTKKKVRPFLCKGAIFKNDRKELCLPPMVRDYFVLSKDEKEALTVVNRSSVFTREESRGYGSFTKKGPMKKPTHSFLGFLNVKGFNTSGIRRSDSIILKLLWKWAYKKHSKKSNKWLIKQYFPKINGFRQNRVFASKELVPLTKNKKKILTGLASIRPFLPLRSKTEERRKGGIKKEKEKPPIALFLAPTCYAREEGDRKKVDKRVDEADRRGCLSAKGLLRKTKTGLISREDDEVVLTTVIKEKVKPSFQYFINPKPLLLNNTPIIKITKKIMSDSSFLEQKRSRGYQAHNELKKTAFRSLQFNLFFSVPTSREISITQDKKKKKKYSPKKICDQTNDLLYSSYRKYKTKSIPLNTLFSP